MKHGHRHQATNIVSRMLVHIHGMTRSPPLPIVRQALKMASPSIRMRSQKTGGKVLLKPEALSEKQRTRAAIKSILQATYSRSGKTLEERLAREVVGIVNGKSPALDQKASVHKLATANRSVAFIAVLPLLIPDSSFSSNVGIRV
jgi:small subunit ribosomal protein S7